MYKTYYELIGPSMQKSKLWERDQAREEKLERRLPSREEAWLTVGSAGRGRSSPDLALHGKDKQVGLFVYAW